MPGYSAATNQPKYTANQGIYYGGKAYDMNQLNRLLNKETSGGSLTGTEAIVLGAYKRATNQSSVSYAGQKQVTTKPYAPNKTAISTNTMKPSATTIYKAPTPLTVPKPITTDNAATTTPIDTPPAPGPTTFQDMLNSIQGTTLVPQTITPYTMKDDKALNEEASKASAGIYTPIMDALKQRQQDYKKALDLGRTDLAEQYAQQIADLKALALSAETQIKQRSESTARGYDTAMQNLAQQTLQARQTNAGNYGAAQNVYGGELGQLGLGSGAPGGQNLLKDQNFADAMLQGIGNIGQTGMQAGKTMSDSALAQLAANNTTQFTGLQGQSRILRDQALRDLEAQILDKTMQGNVDIGQTQSDWNSKAYELLKNLQGVEWQKYMDSGGAAFGQGLSNAQLVTDLFKSTMGAGGGVSEEEKANWSPTDRGFYELQKAFGNSPNWEKYREVWDILRNPRMGLKEGPIPGWGPESIAGGDYPGLGDFANDPAAAGMIGPTKARAFGSLFDRDLVTGKNDPNWANFLRALEYAMGTNKNYGAGAVG